MAFGQINTSPAYANTKLECSRDIKIGYFTRCYLIAGSVAGAGFAGPSNCYRRMGETRR